MDARLTCSTLCGGRYIVDVDEASDGEVPTTQVTLNFSDYEDNDGDDNNGDGDGDGDGGNEEGAGVAGTRTATPPRHTSPPVAPPSAASTGDTLNVHDAAATAVAVVPTPPRPSPQRSRGVHRSMRSPASGTTATTDSSEYVEHVYNTIGPFSPFASAKRAATALAAVTAFASAGAARKAARTLATRAGHPSAPTEGSAPGAGTPDSTPAAAQQAGNADKSVGSSGRRPDDSTNGHGATTKPEGGAPSGSPPPPPAPDAPALRVSIGVQAGVGTNSPTVSVRSHASGTESRGVGSLALVPVPNNHDGAQKELQSKQRAAGEPYSHQLAVSVGMCGNRMGVCRDLLQHGVWCRCLPMHLYTHKTTQLGAPWWTNCVSFARPAAR